MMTRRAAVRSLDLSRSRELVCVNLMCENVGQRCACRLAMWFGRNPMPELERLSLARNNLTVLPALDLPSLKVLDLSYNKLREISSAATLAALEEVNLEGNVRLADVSNLLAIPSLRSITLWEDKDDDDRNDDDDPDDERPSAEEVAAHVEILAPSIRDDWTRVGRGRWRRG